MGADCGLYLGLAQAWTEGCFILSNSANMVTPAMSKLLQLLM